VRIAMNPRDLSAKLENHEGRAAVLFGREDLGLFNEELLKCDMLVKIPTSEAYPILNISHAASIVFYELFSAKVEKRPVREVTDLEREKLNEFFRMLLLATDHPRHTMERTEVMFRRLIGRAVLSEWEYHILMGVLGDAVNRIKHKQG
ncbi:MAG: RNA methyltransferase, partial [Thermoplasmata archaeon]|nr:RNA methyltransferase [Thermoplasmata archaeon]